MPHNVNGYETAYLQFGGHARSVHPGVSRQIFDCLANAGQCRMLSPSVSDASVYKPTHSASHGIGGNATHRTRIVVVGKSIIVDIGKRGRSTKINRKHPI